jgi:hypothetical protein
VWSVLFGEVIAGAGVCWQAPGVDAWCGEPDLGYLTHPPGTADDLPHALEKVEQVRRTQFKKLWEDCLGICWFAAWGVQDVTKLAPKALAEAVGWDDFTTEEAMAAGERVVNLMRVVYAQRGFKKEDEFDASPRLLEPPTSGSAKGKSIAAFLPAMVDEYYRQMGWEVATGMPTRPGLARLGLEEYTASIERRRLDQSQDVPNATRYAAVGCRTRRKRCSGNRRSRGAAAADAVLRSQAPYGLDDLPG